MSVGPGQAGVGSKAGLPAGVEIEVWWQDEARIGQKNKITRRMIGAVAEVVGIWGGVVSGVFNPADSGVGAPDWRPRRDEEYHDGSSW